MESEKIIKEKEKDKDKESPTQYYHFLPKSQDVSSLIDLQKNCNEIAKPYEQKGLQDAIALHGTRSDKIQGLMFEDLTKGSVAQQAHLKQQPIEFRTGDGAGKLPNGQKTSVEADLVLVNPETGNYKEIQLKAGANKQSTISLAEKHYKKYPKSEIEAHSFKGYENQDPLVKSSIEFEKIKMEMMKPKHLNDFMKKNEGLIQSVGEEFQTVQNEKRTLEKTLIWTEESLKINQEKAQKVSEQLQNLENKNQKLEQHLKTLNEKINEYSENIPTLKAEIKQKEVTCQDHCKTIAEKMVTFYNKRLLDLEAFSEGAISGSMTGYITALSLELAKWATGEQTFDEFFFNATVGRGGKTALVAGATGGYQAWGKYASEFAMSGKMRILVAGAENINIILTAGAFMYSSFVLLRCYSSGKMSEEELVKEFGLNMLGIGNSFCLSLAASAVGGIPGVIIGIVGGIIINLVGNYFGGVSSQEKSYEERMKEAEKRIEELRGLHIKLIGGPEHMRDMSQINKVPQTGRNYEAINQVPQTGRNYSAINQIPTTGREFVWK